MVEVFLILSVWFRAFDDLVVPSDQKLLRRALDVRVSLTDEKIVHLRTAS